MQMLIWGYDGSDWHEVKVDSDGYLQIDVLSSALPTDAATATKQDSLLTEVQSKLETADLNIEAVTKDLQVDVKSSALPSDAATQTTLAAILAELLAKLETADLSIDASKHLQVDLKAYSGRTMYREQKYNLSATTGYNTLSSTAVSSGEVWIVNTIRAFDNTTACTKIVLNVHDGTDYTAFRSLDSPAAKVALEWSGEITLAANGYIIVEFTGCTSGDDLYLQVTGYKMTIA